MTTDKQFYQIRIEGRLDHRWGVWFEGMSMSYPKPEAQETLLDGYVVDQAALHGLLNKIRDLNLPLVEVLRLPSRNESGKRKTKYQL